MIPAPTSLLLSFVILLTDERTGFFWLYVAYVVVQAYLSAHALLFFPSSRELLPGCTGLPATTANTVASYEVDSVVGHIVDHVDQNSRKFFVSLKSRHVFDALVTNDCRPST